MNIDPSEIKKILCIKPRGIGDIVLSTIILENLTTHFPSAKIHYLTEEFAQDAVKNNLLVDKVLSMKKSEFVFSVAKRLRKEKYDLILDLWSNPRSAQITFLAFAKYRVGFAYRGRKYAYNILCDSGRGNYHSAEHNLELLKTIFVPIISKNILFNLNDDEIKFAQEYFNQNSLKQSNTIGIVPSGGWESKRCDAVKWIEICENILKQKEFNFLILWGPGDEKDATFIKSKLGERCLLAPETNVRELASLISKCKVIIANDSGPMHIAAALGIPTLGIFGPTDPQKHGPYNGNSDYVIKSDLHCIICNKLVCPYNHECMLELDANEVVNKVMKLLN